MDMILRDAGGQMDLLTYDSAGALADVDGTNPPTIAVVDSAGTTVAGFTPSRTGAGTYKALLPANLDTLDTYRAVWSWPNGQSRRSEFELVGGFLFTVAELQAYDTDLATLTAAKITAARTIVEDLFEHPQVTNRAFRPRGRREYLDGTDTAELLVSGLNTYAVVSAKSNGSALTAGDLLDLKVFPHGAIQREFNGTWLGGVRNIEVLYEYGERQVPADITRAALRYAAYLLTKSAFDQERATAQFNDVGGFRLTIAGRDGPTGLPSVDSVLARYSHVKPRVG